MIAVDPCLLRVATLKRLLRERFMSPDEKTVMVALLAGLADEDGLITIGDDELAERLGVSTRDVRDALGVLWARGYLAQLVDPEPDDDCDPRLQITLRREAGDD